MLKITQQYADEILLIHVPLVRAWAIFSKESGQSRENKIFSTTKLYCPHCNGEINQSVNLRRIAGPTVLAVAASAFIFFVSILLDGIFDAGKLIGLVAFLFFIFIVILYLKFIFNRNIVKYQK